MPNATPSLIRRPDAFAVVAAGYRSERDIITQTGLGEHAALADLQQQIEQGRIRRTWYGRYTITEHGRQALLARLTAASRRPLGAAFDPADATIPELWDHEVAEQVLRGSSLTERPSHSAADEYLLDLHGHLLEDAVKRQAKIAALLRRPAEQVIIEDAAHLATNHALLQLVGTDSPLYRILDHPGTSAFDPATGQVTIGLYADGAPAVWPLWNQAGARNGVIAGDAGSGTSVLLRGLLSAVAGSPLVAPHVIDFAGIGALPTMGRPVAVNRGEARQMLGELVDLMRQRKLAQAETGQFWSATPDTPMVLVVLSGLHLLAGGSGFADRTIPLINRLQREGRKLGVGVVGEVKAITSASFGRDEVRSGLLGGNLVHLRSCTKPYGLGQLAADPSRIPSGWHTGTPTYGVGHTADRNAPFRAFYTPDRLPGGTGEPGAAAAAAVRP